MPTYDVKCDLCGYKWEVILPVNKKDQVPLCERCSSAMTRIIWRTFPGIPAPKVRPYDLLDRPIPEEPKSFGPPKGGWKSLKKGGK
ncbi:MAG: zinc ribbon domain-containing protein [Chloroflexi bacterium]|nr:MAG: zinc ribbon domain-containing protein [Chloroflexota bacterium]